MAIVINLEENEILTPAYLEAWREGYREGYRKGFREGFREGLKEGFEQGYRKAVVECLTIVWGPPDDAIREKIEQAPHTLVQDWVNRFVKASSWDELIEP